MKFHGKQENIMQSTVDKSSVHNRTNSIEQNNSIVEHPFADV
jgi:hypothetical protein